MALQYSLILLPLSVDLFPEAMSSPEVSRIDQKLSLKGTLKTSFFDFPCNSFSKRREYNYQRPSENF